MAEILRKIFDQFKIWISWLWIYLLLIWIVLVVFVFYVLRGPLKLGESIASGDYVGLCFACSILQTKTLHES